MSIVSFQVDLLATSANTSIVEVGRPFMNTMTVEVHSAVALGATPATMRIFSQGESLLPVPGTGAANTILVGSKAPLRLEVKRMLNGPPFRVEITTSNPSAGAITVSVIFEVFNTPYPQTRIHIPVGKEGENPFMALVKGLEPQASHVKGNEK